MKKQFKEEKIVAILREGAAGGKTIGEVCRKHAISEPSFYARRCKYGSLREECLNLETIAHADQARAASQGLGRHITPLPADASDRGLVVRWCHYTKQLV